MSESIIPPTLNSTALEQLESLLEKIDAYDGKWFEDRSTKEGNVIMLNRWSAPLSYEAKKFLYNNELIISFNWGEWQEGRDFFKTTDDNKFKNIDREYILKLLSAVARNDRFNEGAWARLFEKGDGQKLFRRLLEIDRSS